MDWWEFAEHSGYPGDELNVSRITCAFCDTEGNFGRVQHEEIEAPRHRKSLELRYPAMWELRQLDDGLLVSCQVRGFAWDS
jgi:hypothetical protein